MTASTSSRSSSTSTAPACAQRGPGGAPRGGQRAGVRPGELADVVPADHERDHRLARGQPGAPRRAAAARRRPTRRAARPRVVAGSSARWSSTSGGRDVDGVAQPDREAHPVPGLGEQERQRVVDPAAGRDHRDPPGRHGARRRARSWRSARARGRGSRRCWARAARCRSRAATVGERRLVPLTLRPPASAKPPPQTSAAPHPGRGRVGRAPSAETAAGTQSTARSIGPVLRRPRPRDGRPAAGSASRALTSATVPREPAAASGP